MSETNKVAIKVENLTKVYKLYNKASDRLKEALNPLRKKYHQDFYALKDINFEILKGQTVGIIGKNGSGKSTLLKILTGVLTPTAGNVTVNGKIAALLELGAGFNPELTGYENIFFNGSLMGFTKDEMEQRVPEILEFADIGEFINQPVKMYSSGMFARLAFAVAVNVEPNILIIDEALSVGDLRFQQKCIRKFGEFVKTGKTIIFVGHDTGMMVSFCSRCIWLHEGLVVEDGDPKKIINNYISHMSYGMISEKNDHRVSNEVNWTSLSGLESFGDGEAEIIAVSIVDEQSQKISKISGGERVHIRLKVNISKTIVRPIFGFIVKNRVGVSIFGGNTFIHQIKIDAISSGSYEYEIVFLFPHLSNGDYMLTLALADGTQELHVQKYWVHDCYIFQVSNNDLRYCNGDGVVLIDNFNFRKISF